MWYYKEKNENGEFEDKDGVRYSLTECYRVIATDGKRNAELGYTEFENMEECLSTWGLSQVPKPDYETKSTLAVNDIDKLSSTEFIIKPFADIRNKLLAKFKKS